MNKKPILILISILSLILLVLGWWLIIRDPNPPLQIETPAPQTELIFPTSAQEINWDDREIFKSGLTADAQFVLAELPQASTYYISLEINEEITQDIIGHQIVRYFNAESEPLEEIYFRLFPNFEGGRITISNLTVDSAEAKTYLEAADSALRIELQESLAPGESVVIELDFILGIPTEMGGNYGLFGYFDDVLVLDVFYPVIPAYDEDGWYNKHPQMNGDLTYQDASFYLVQVKAPAEMTLASSGVAVDHQEDGTQQTVVFAAGPARDFYLAGSLEFVELKEQVGDLTVKVHTKKEYKLHQEYALDYSLKALEIYSERVGDYPYTEFEVITSPMRALGIEYPGITSIVVDEFVAGAVMYGMPTENLLESTLAHEVGHMWFYNAVGNDQQNEPWVDEALVQYLTYIYYLDRYCSGQGYIDSWIGRWNRVGNAPIPIGMPSGDYEGQEYGAIVYGRGPLFFLELENELGLDTVMTAIENYFDTYLWENASGEDLRAVFEEACECDLSTQFEEWVYDK